MSDTKNILLAWTSSVTTFFAAADRSETIATISAIVLPVVFFAAGKTIDVFVQIWLSRKREKRNDK